MGGFVIDKCRRIFRHAGVKASGMYQQSIVSVLSFGVNEADNTWEAFAGCRRERGEWVGDFEHDHSGIPYDKGGMLRNARRGF
jgi:hypothetical protein